MKVALLGKGKTGGKVLEILIEQKIDHTVFDSKNQPNLEKLKTHDLIIVFLAGDIFKNYIPLCVESRLPVVCGSTGFKFEDDFNKKLQSQNLKWIHATNFSLGMNIIHQMIKIISQAPLLYKNYKFLIHEIHHTKKLDAPSGTALSWGSWLNLPVDISSERKGDVVGIHELLLSTPHEEILLKHSALDRKIFAEGAMFAADKLITDETLKPGLHLFEDIIFNLLNKGSLS